MKAIKGHQMRYYKKGLEMIMSITKGHIRSIPCSLLSDCKNVQKSVLKSVNVQRTGKSILQMFAFSFFDGTPYLQIFAYFASLHCPSESLLTLTNRRICTDYQLLIFTDITFCIVICHDYLSQSPPSAQCSDGRR